MPEHHEECPVAARPVTPGVRVGQIWQESRARKGRTPRRVEITGQDSHHVHCVALNAGQQQYGPEIRQPRDAFEQRYQLVSEGGAHDA